VLADSYLLKKFLAHKRMVFPEPARVMWEFGYAPIWHLLTNTIYPHE